MSVYVNNIVIDAGEDFTQDLTLSDSLGAVVNLTGYAASSYIRKHPESSTIVAGFGIYNILNMLIYEKMNDIAILKAVGFSGKDVQRIFISQALIIGLIGGVLGLILGVAVLVPANMPLA